VPQRAGGDRLNQQSPPHFSVFQEFLDILLFSLPERCSVLARSVPGSGLAIAETLWGGGIAFCPPAPQRPLSKRERGPRLGGEKSGTSDGYSVALDQHVGNARWMISMMLPSQSAKLQFHTFDSGQYTTSLTNVAPRSSMRSRTAAQFCTWNAR
jgi:hypothetical protein